MHLVFSRGQPAYRSGMNPSRPGHANLWGGGSAARGACGLTRAGESVLMGIVMRGMGRHNKRLGSWGVHWVRDCARVALVAAACGVVPGPVRAQTDQPVITAVRAEGTNLVVTARVPAGLRRVTLECRDRLGARSWEPRAVARLDGAGGTVTFRLGRSRPFEVVRLRADLSEPLPASFYTGTNTFLGEPATGAGPETGVVYYSLDAVVSPPTESGRTVSREVVESDIWKVRGSKLYFFNQYRGLQILDIANPDAAVLQGTLELPAVGEQMYLIETNYAVLLGRPDCGASDSAVWIVDVAQAQPAVIAVVAVSGTIVESRMVGQALYVASQGYRPVSGSAGSAWEWGTLVSALDLARPEAPVARGTLWFAGYGHVVAATDVYLFVVTQSPTNWWQGIVNIIDISDPAGSIRPVGTVTPAGMIADKFKLNYTGSVLTTISEDRHLNNGTRLVTKLETWRLPQPAALSPGGIVKLGELALGAGERLRGTRFDGDRVYVVTFFQIDPLWVVDLADPARPRVAGSVDVPGWSTYIEPLGDRLVTVGVETNRVAVSLFDVADPAAPTLLSRVVLGQTWSWSEANANEKAFTVLAEAGLILVPFNGDLTNRYCAVLQLVDLTHNSLQARGQIVGGFPFRRASVFADRIIAITGREFLSVDATDRDQPRLSGWVELAWSVDRVFLVGDYLIEVESDASWGAGSRPAVRVALAARPHQTLNRLQLDPVPLLGATTWAGRLYLAQGPLGVAYVEPVALDHHGLPAPNPTVPFRLTVVDVSALPALPVLGQTEAGVAPLGWGRRWQAVWPKPDLLVWAGGQSQWWWCPICSVPLLQTEALAVSRPWPPYYSGGGGRLIAFDVSDPAAPQWASEVNLGTNRWWNFSSAFATDGLVYLSHQESEFIPGLPSPWQTTLEPALVDGRVRTEAGSSLQPAAPIIGTWLHRTFLDVIDYADARQPLVRRPVSLPGRLVGLSHQGALLYTVGPHWSRELMSADLEFLDACAYDGVAAHLVASLPLPAQWPHPVLVVGTNVLIGWPQDSASPACRLPAIRTWTVSTQGRWVELGCHSVASAVSALAQFTDLLAAQCTDSTVALFDLRDPAALRWLTGAKPTACVGVDLANADGALGRGLWLPLGAYGVATIPLAP